MQKENVYVCPKCGGLLSHYDRVKRFLKTKNCKRYIIWMERCKCSQCKSVHRMLPEEVIPYKQYESFVIFGVIEGLITPYVLGFEDFPTELTMKRWLSIDIECI